MSQADQTDNYYRGRPTPKHLKDGPTEDRKCTDFLCFIIFGAFWFGIVTIAGAALHTGNPEKFIHPWDQYGNACGTTDATANYPYLYWIQSTDPDAVNPFTYNQTVCVKQCPDVYKSSFASDDCATDYTNPAGCSALSAYPTTPLEYFCLPSNNNTYTQFIGNVGELDFGFAYSAIADLKATWWMTLIVGVIALMIGFLYLLLMKYFSGIMIWALLVIWMIIWSAAGFLCIEQAAGANIAGILPDSLASADPTWLHIIGGLCILVAFVSLVLICCFFNRINLAVAVLKAAADYLEDEKMVLLVPPVFFVLSLGYYIFWIFVAIYIFAMNNIVAGDSNGPIPNVEWTSTAIGLMAYHVVGLFWNHAFIVSLSQFIISSSVCLWYFGQGKSQVESSTIWKSVKRSFYHLGSIALGSFIIALVGIIKLIFEYIAKRVKSQETGPLANAKVSFCASCCACMVACFEKSLKFVTKHAYIQMAMTSESFCAASEDAFHLLLRNALRFGTVHGLASVFMLLGQLVVSVGATFIGYLIITKTDHFTEAIYSPFLPTILFFLSSLSVAHVFMGVYETSADTIIHCYAMDDEIHDGEVKYAPKALRDFVDTHAGVRKLTLNEY